MKPSMSLPELNAVTLHGSAGRQGVDVFSSPQRHISVLHHAVAPSPNVKELLRTSNQVGRRKKTGVTCKSSKASIYEFGGFGKTSRTAKWKCEVVEGF